MKLTRERKIYIAVFGLALLGLVVDQLILSTSDEDPVTASMGLLIGPSEASAALPPVAGGAPISTGNHTNLPELLGAAEVARLLETVAQRNRLQMDQVPDAFKASARWSATDNTHLSNASLDAFSRRKLTSIIAGGRAGTAVMVDGKMVHLGQSIDGFKLVSVEKTSALFELRGSQVRLSLGADAVARSHYQPQSLRFSNALK